MATLKENETVQREQNTTPETKVDVSQNQEIAEAVVTSENELATHSVEASTKIETQALAQQTITENEQRETKVLEQHMQAEENTLAKWTKAETKTLQEEIERTPKALSNREIAKIKDNETLKLVADERIKKCETLRSGIQTAEWSNKSKRELREKIQRAIKDMKKMTKDIDRMETKWQAYNNTNNYKNRLWEIIFDYYSSWEPARQIIVMWWRVPMIRWTVDSKRDAKKDSNYAENNAKYQIDMSEIKKNTALYTLIWVSASEWWDYCDFVWQWWISLGHPVYLQHTAGFNQVRQYNPDLYRALTPKWQITYNTYCQRDPARYEAYCRNNNIVCRPKSFNEKMWKNVADVLAKVFPWIDSDPRKRQAREKAWSVLALWGAAVLWFKFLQSLFSKKHEWKWKEVGLYWWGLLALLNADKIVNWTKDAFGRHPAEKTKMLSESFKTYWFSDTQAMEMADRYVWAPVTTMSALHFIPIYELESQHILEDKNGEFEFNYNNYENYINKFAWDKDQKDQVLKAWKKLDKDKSVWTWLKAFWIATRDKLMSLFWSDKKKTLADTDEVKNWWDNMVERVRNWVNAELYNNKLRIKNPDDMDMIMSEYGDWQKSKEEKNRLMLDWMKRWLLELSSDDKNYTINDMLTKDKYKLNIDLENMTMKWFKNGTNEIKFSSYGELFETVYITEWIKENFAWRTDAKDAAPFHVNLRWQIEFNNTEWYEIHKNETAVISLKKLKTDLPTIKNNRDAYNDYLNKWWLSSL